MLLFISVVPVLVLLVFIRRADRFHAEPMKLLIRLMVFGMISVIPIILVEIWLSRMNVYSGDLAAMYDAFVVAGFSEETFKWLIVMIFAFGSVEYDEPLDGIVYAVFVSMGFAVVENIMYVYGNGFNNGIMRAVTAVPAHMLFGVMMGYYLSMYKFVGRKYYLVLSVLIPILLHGSYNFILMANNWYLVLFIPYMMFMWWLATKRIKKYQMISILIVDPIQSDIDESEITEELIDKG